MERIDSTNVAENLHGVGKHGFHGGNPQTGEKSTYFTPGWCNGLQEEVVRVIEAAGITPSSESYEQLLAAIKYFAWGDGKSAAPWVAKGGSLTNGDLTDGTRAGIGADLAITNRYSGALNNLIDVGEYYFFSQNNADALAKNSPTLNSYPHMFGLVKVWREKQDIVYQTFHSSDNKMFIRYRHDNGVWMPWSHLLGTTNSISIIGSNGAQSIGGGLIEQWGYSTADINGYAWITFPIAFPNAFFVATCIHVGGDVVSFAEIGGTRSLNSVQVRLRDSNKAVSTWGFYWRALGC